MAALCGASPVQPSSGKTTGLRRIDPTTRGNAQRRTTQGKTTKEIMRGLKRHLVRELFPLLKADLQQANSTR